MHDLPKTPVADFLCCLAALIFIYFLYSLGFLHWFYSWAF